MAAGEYVSVSSQRDTEHADLERERIELAAAPDAELAELAAIYERRGPAVGPEDCFTSSQPSSTRSDLLAVHAREELGIDPAALANPVQASLVSALQLRARRGAAHRRRRDCADIGSADPHHGRHVDRPRVAQVRSAPGSVGAPLRRAAVRVFVGGTLALLISLGIGKLTGSVV